MPLNEGDRSDIYQIVRQAIEDDRREQQEEAVFQADEARRQREKLLEIGSRRDRERVLGGLVGGIGTAGLVALASTATDRETVQTVLFSGAALCIGGLAAMGITSVYHFAREAQSRRSATTNSAPGV